MRLLEDGPHKAALIDRMVEILQQDAPILFGYFPPAAAAYQSWVENAKPSGLVQNALQYYDLDADLRLAKNSGMESSRALAACCYCAWDRTPRLGSSCSARSPTGQAPAAAAVEWKEPLMINYLLRRVVYGI